MEQVLAYTLDASDRITGIDGAWDDFAAANGCPELTRAAVIGRGLFEFIAGEEAREISRILLARARAGHEVDVGFRCDAPGRRRFLRLALARTPADGVRCGSTLVREEPRPAQALLDPRAPRSQAMVRICSWCKKVEAHGSWCEIEEAADALGLMEGDTLPLLNHGICPECRRKLR